MRTSLILGLALAGVSAVYGLGRTCFPDAIPEELWENIMFDGEEMPIRIWENAWDSGTISAWIFVILLTEKMGYNATLPPGDGGTTSRPIVFKLAGCPGLPGGTRNQVIEDPAVCAQYVREYHFSLESWQSAYSYIPIYTRDFGLRAAVDLGSIGYSGYDGMFIMGGSLEASLNATGLGLDFYRNWNAQFFNPGQFVKKVNEIDTNQVATCATAVEVGYPGIAQIYLDATGDADGVETVDGNLVLKCYQGKWWLSPPCRADPDNCPVLITGTAGWGMIPMIQQAYFHNMPVAFATAWIEPNAYQTLNKATQGLMYWWVPDTQFTLDNPKKMIFPDPSPAEQAQNLWRTMAANLMLSKWAAGGMRRAADRAYTLLENLQISDSDMNGILKLYLATSPPDAWATACQWLLNNEANHCGPDDLLPGGQLYPLVSSSASLRPSSSLTRRGLAPHRLEGLTSRSMLTTSRSGLGSESGARRPMSPEEQQSERERMHDMVREFAKHVVKGMPGELLVPGGSSRACTYLFDKALRVFTIKVDGEPTFALQLADVWDVKKDLRGTPFAALMDLPPPHAVSGEQLKKKAVSIFYRSPKQDKEVLVLLLPQQYDQERFYACMKILRWALEIEMKPRMNADI